MDDMDDVAAFWQHHAEGFCPQGNPLHVWQELLLIAARTPVRFREALQAAAVAVGARYCNHDTPPGPLPDISKLPERQAAVQQHAGLCGKYHAEHIANIDVTMVEERAAGAEITTKRMRNQACYDAGTALNARGRGVQLRRQECFTQACRAVWPDDQPLPVAVLAALSM
ncbi:unnamed protein product [Ectocarpus sp. CCAP 1310/34]|nr:unnamed protein product [Ectocarpus sp. CCAP 1310/34]